MKFALSVVLLSFPWIGFAQQPITVQGRQFENVQALHDFLTQRPAINAADSTGDADEAVSTGAAFVASRQEGGKEELRAIISAQRTRLSARTRSYIETQLLSAP